MSGIRLDQDFEWGKTPIQSELRRLMGALESRISPLENEVVNWEAAVQTLQDVGLARLDETLGPLFERLLQASSLGFLTVQAAGLERSLTEGETLNILATSSGYQLFTPTPSLLIVDDNDSDNWGMLRLLQYVSNTGELSGTVIYASKTQTSDSWTISCNSAVWPLMLQTLQEALGAQEQAQSAVSLVNETIVTINQLLAAVANGPVVSVAGQTGEVILGISDITGLVSALADKATTTALNSGLASKQNASAKLTAIVNLVWGADQLLFMTGVGSVGSSNLTPDARALLSKAQSEMITYLGIASKASTAEVTAGVDDSKFVTPAGASAVYNKKLMEFGSDQNASFTLTSAFAGKTVSWTKSYDGTITLANNVPAGSSVLINCEGTGQITFTTQTGASMASQGDRFKSNGLYSQITAWVKSNTTGSNAAWRLSGDLTTNLGDGAQ